MSHYVHSIPGRLRVKAQAFKNKPKNAEAASTLLGALRGVHSVETNPITGSLLIRYDDAVVKSARILGALVAEGLIEQLPSQRPSPKVLKSAVAPGWRRIAASLSEVLPEVIADPIADKLARRAAAALVSAVI
jgi:hypothetical protein